MRALALLALTCALASCQAPLRAAAAEDSLRVARWKAFLSGRLHGPIVPNATIFAWEVVKALPPPRKRKEKHP
jgi:hypothetical protein